MTLNKPGDFLNVIQSPRGLSDDTIHNSIRDLTKDIGEIKKELALLSSRIDNIEKKNRSQISQSRFKLMAWFSFASVFICLLSFLFSVYAHFSPSDKDRQLTGKSEGQVEQEIHQQSKEK